MRLAIFADIHANRQAFTACLEAARAKGAERIVCLGDIVGYGADPEWAVDTVMALAGEGTPVVLAPLFTKDLNYDPVKDFAPVAPLGWFGSILVTRPDFPANSVPELITYLRAARTRPTRSTTRSSSCTR